MRAVPRAASAWPSEPARPSLRRPAALVLGRILRSADFERVLSKPACARSAHFAVHFATGLPTRTARRVLLPRAAARPVFQQLSTGDAPSSSQAVDDSADGGLIPLKKVGHVWLGTVVPKRHARRAVSRTLLKRQIHAAALRREETGAPLLRPGLWVVRLCAPFDRARFSSAASPLLRSAARGELDAVLLQAACKLASSSPSGAA